MTEAPLSTAEQEALDVAGDPVLEQMLAEERVETTGIDTNLLMRLLGYLRPHSGLATVAVLLAFIEAALMTLPAWLIGLAVDRARGDTSREGGLVALFDQLSTGWAGMVGAEDPARAAFVFFGLAVAATWGLRWVSGASMSYLVQKLGQHVLHDLRRDVYDHVTGMHMDYFHTNPVGRLVNRTTFDVQSLAEMFSDAFAEGMRDLLFIVLLMTVMLLLDPVLAGVLIATFPLLVLVGVVYRRLARPAMRTHSAVQSRMNAWLAENLAGMRENHLYRREERRRAEYHALTDAHQSSVTRMIQAWGLLRPAMMLVSAFGSAAILGLGYNRVTAGIITVGVLLTFVQYTTRLWRPVRNLTEKLNLIQTALTAAERIADVLDTPSEMTDPPDADPDLEVTRGAIRYDDVRFRYASGDDDVLRGISVDVEPGQMLALVGDTGAGKSTIVHLLSRFYDVTGGAVSVDGTDVRRYPLAKLRRGIALVPQDVTIFAGSLRENITLGADVPDARIVEALQAVRAWDFVSALDGGLDHEMEESGRTLSAGQRQLLSFARALVIDPPILVLDEATANVDSETEARIQTALEELTEGRTSVVIAHRLSTIRHADQILVLRHGRVVEQGAHDDLVAMDGEYARLVRMHMTGPEAD